MDDMFKHYLYVIIHNDLLEGFSGKGCGSTKDGVGNGLGNFLVHNDVSLIGFVIEESPHRSY